MTIKSHGNQIIIKNSYNNVAVFRAPEGRKKPVLETFINYPLIDAVEILNLELIEIC